MLYIFVSIFVFMCAWDVAGRTKVYIIENISIGIFAVCMLTFALHWLTS
jgi:hypothetical protein